MTTLREAVWDTMSDKSFQAEHLDGATPGEILAETQRRTGGFELCSPLDVADELKSIYGMQRW